MKLRKEKQYRKSEEIKADSLKWSIKLINPDSMGKKERKHKKTSIRKERENITTDIKKIIREYYELYMSYVWELRWNAEIPQNHGRDKTNFHFSKCGISSKLQNSVNKLVFFFFFFWSLRSFKKNW